MNPVQVEVILANRTKPLTLVPLFALQPDREPYHVMLLQPHGFVEVNENRIGHADAARGYNTCRTFLDAASAKHADLVVTPEYCTPWKVVGDIVSGEIRPDEGAIWALGCESITPAELRELGARIASAGEGIFLYHEPLIPRQEAQKRYIDPLLYVFWTKDQQAAPVLCLVVQFKTVPCKDERDIEQTSLYIGQNVYIFNRGPNEIRMLGVICSDAFVFTNELIEEYHPNSLILHIQLNPKPAHSDYAAYRARLCSVGSSNNVELLCLNWAQNVRELKSDGTHKNWENIAGSGWYIPPTKFRSDDTVIDEAHRKGIYYCVVSKKWHVFYLNYTEQVLLLRKQKLLITGPQALLPATCLSVAERWGWNDVEQNWSPGSVPNDGFVDLLGTYGGLQGHLPQMCEESPLAVERALELLEGPRGNPTSWHTTSELQSLQVADEESIRRVTVHQEIAVHRPGVIFRKRRLQRAQAAVTLPGQQVPWPSSVGDLETGFKFKWHTKSPHHNVIPSVGQRGSAALMYLDEESDDNQVDAMYRKLAEGLTKHAIDQAFRDGLDPNDALARSKERLCIVFRRGHSYHTRGADNDITQPADKLPLDIAGGHK